MPSNKVRTRFAPSPTGYMHVGNLRPALYPYLMEKHEGGTFILRIEDTDQGRYVEGAVDVIYNTLRETGLLWDEGPDVGGPVGPYVQSERMGMFKQYAEQLVAEGKAYYCFCTEERLEALRAEQRANVEMTHYDGCCRDLPKEEVEKRLAAGEPYVIRQKIPREGVTGFDDVVYGHIEVNNSEMDDQILIKTDGMPTYNFANVVDDHLMGITHVIRGSEYLSSTPKYNLLYQAFGWEIPTYIHCPPVMKDAQNKLSKRNGDASYQDLVAKGYLTEAILNYICLLGWSPKGEYAEQLVAEGKAYYCFCTEERLEALHAEQRAHGEMTHYDGCCRDLPREEVEKRLAAGEPYVIRQKIPREGVTGFDDMVYGHIEVNNSEMDDQILIKTDGMPTYNFANVVDDHLMGITHVIRGSEYLSSTPKYNLLYQAFGWNIPNYIHCPPVMKDAQNKLSKRNGDASYQDLVAKGYLTEAILNYICLLGWSPKGEYAEQEIFSLADLVKIWTPDGISKSPAIFDPLKLRAINAEYIRRLSPEEFLAKAEPWIDSAVHTPINKKLLCANLQPRCEVLGEIPEQLDFFDAMPEYDVSLYANKKQKTTPESAKEALEALLPVLSDEALDFNDRDTVFDACKAKAEELGKKNGWLLYPLGIALSGKQRTPGGGTDLACMMGRETTLERVKAAIEKLNG